MGFLDKLFGSKEVKPAKPAALAVDADAKTVYAAVGGRVEEIANVPDPMFAGEVMGKTIAVWPTDGNVYAPVAGTVTAAMPHAFGIAGDDGVEVLIHIGVDTVEMNGDGFSVWAKKDEHVAAGQPLVTFDIDKVKKAGHPEIVMTIVTNSDDYDGLTKVAGAEVAAGAPIITV